MKTGPVQAPIEPPEDSAESIALEGYQSGRLLQEQVRRMVGFGAPPDGAQIWSPQMPFL